MFVFVALSLLPSLLISYPCPNPPLAVIHQEKTEFELTGGPLSDLFDRFFRYVPRATLFAGTKYGAKFADVETFFTRGTKDPVKVSDAYAPDALPDGRFVVRATAQQQCKQEFSLVRGRDRSPCCCSLTLWPQVYIEDKKKSAAKDEDSEMLHKDRMTVLLQAQRSLLSLAQFWKLRCILFFVLQAMRGKFMSRRSPTEAEKLCIPAVHTKWPKVRISLSLSLSLSDNFLLITHSLHRFGCTG